MRHAKRKAPSTKTPSTPVREQQGFQEHQSVEELIQLREKIDQELNQRLTQNLCLLLADVVGSTSFFQKHGDVQGRLFIQRHHDTLSPLVTEHGGKVIKTIGDALMVSFEDARRALDCAVAMQRTLWKANQQRVEDTALQTKISLHYGSALVEAHDVYGDLVNMSARLNDLVEPDQIVISQSVYEQVKEHTSLPILPLEPFRWKEGEKGLVVYEVLWRQKTEEADKPLAFRDFRGAYRECFYCGLREHAATKCPSKQLTRNIGRLERLGYLPLQEILTLFQQEDLNTTASPESPGQHIFDAFYEIFLPYQLRFLIRVWLATSEDWREVERQQTVTVSPLAGTRLWRGFDCLRVGRLDEAQRFLLAAMDSNPGDYKPYITLGFLAMEKADPFTALQYWRKGLSLATNNLQAAYLHLLIHRLYSINGKTQLALQELRKALSKDFYLYEAKYRQVALSAKEDNDDQTLTKLQKLIQDDRVVYLKVLLDPAFAPLRAKLQPLLSTLLKEVQSIALDHMKRITEELNALREWYQQPTAELVAMERAVDRMRQHIKSESYFGYRDAAHEGEVLQKRIQKLISRRKTHLHRAFTTTLEATQRHLIALASSPQHAKKSPADSRMAKLQKELSRLRTLNHFPTANQFWRAWRDLHALKTAVQQLDPSYGFSKHPRLWYILLFGLGGSAIVDTSLFGVYGYLAYFSRLYVPEQQLFFWLACGALVGFLAGSGVEWIVRWYRSRRRASTLA
jgi:class 3 adenylate cyclase/tetratricopeptide (TPR) repeat protein